MTRTVNLWDLHVYIFFILLVLNVMSAMLLPFWYGLALIMAGMRLVICTATSITLYFSNFIDVFSCEESFESCDYTYKSYSIKEN